MLSDPLATLSILLEFCELEFGTRLEPVSIRSYFNIFTFFMHA